MKYRGRHIYECEMANPHEHGGRWIVQTYHQTGLPWSCRENPHYWTQRQAKAAVREYVKRFGARGA